MGITQSHRANSGSSVTLYGHYTVTQSEFRKLYNIIWALHRHMERIQEALEHYMDITPSHGANSGSSVTLYGYYTVTWSEFSSSETLYGHYTVTWSEFMKLWSIIWALHSHTEQI